MNYITIMLIFTAPSVNCLQLFYRYNGHMGKHSIIKFAVGASKVKYIALAVFTSLFVVSLLLYGNISFLDIFQKPDPYKEALVLFYGEGCEQCERVDDYLQAN